MVWAKQARMEEAEGREGCGLYHAFVVSLAFRSHVARWRGRREQEPGVVEGRDEVKS
jgi:hypothetical protein